PREADLGGRGPARVRAVRPSPGNHVFVGSMGCVGKGRTAVTGSPVRIPRRRSLWMGDESDAADLSRFEGQGGGGYRWWRRFMRLHGGGAGQARHESGDLEPDL